MRNKSCSEKRKIKATFRGMGKCDDTKIERMKIRRWAEDDNHNNNYYIYISKKWKWYNEYGFDVKGLDRDFVYTRLSHRSLESKADSNTHYFSP